MYAVRRPNPDEFSPPLQDVTNSWGTDDEQAVAVMLEKYEICRDLFHGFDYRPFKTGTPHLGWASMWGYEQFYDDWQEAMARRAARIKGAEWLD